MPILVVRSEDSGVGGWLKVRQRKRKLTLASGDGIARNYLAHDFLPEKGRAEITSKVCCKGDCPVGDFSSRWVL